MTFSLSPAVIVQEIDLTNVIPAVSTSTASTVGQFKWGPVEEITIVSNEEILVELFGRPSRTVYKDFLTASSFLSYARDLRLIRVVDDATALNAAYPSDSNNTSELIKNLQEYSAMSFGSDINLFYAKYPGVLGNSIGVAWVNATGWADVDSNGVQNWPWSDLFESAPLTDEMHIVVYDADGVITGNAGTVLERWAFVSTVAGTKSFDGTTAYFKDKISNGSKYLYVANETLMSGSNDGVALIAGNDGSVISEGDRTRGFALLQNSEVTDVSLVFASGAGVIASKWIIDNVAEYRKDCVALVSPLQSDCVGIYSDQTILNNIKVTRDTYGSSSYAVMDSAYKYTYDRYNDAYRWIPLNGDIAGVIARTDANYASWYSPAGYEKGRIKNSIKLSMDQNKQVRDDLYKAGINPCTAFPVEGALLFGDKTLLSRPSAFAHINVRRLFITLEKAIATASKYYLFDQNNTQTRTRFVNMVEPFLREVQGREGITDFRVVCDESNNPGDVIDRGEFVAAIYIKPTRSIQTIRLSFVAVRTGVDFDEVIINSSQA